MSNSIAELASAANVATTPGGTDVSVGKIDPWDKNSAPRWLRLDDFSLTLDELWASHPSFNALKFVERHQQPESQPPASTQKPVHNIFRPPSSDRSHLPPLHSTMGGSVPKDRVLYNDIIRLCEVHGADFSKE